MAPETATPVRIVCEGNYFNEEMSADAAGLVVTLFTLSHMAERVPSLADRYYDLMEYIDCHPEAGKITPPLIDGKARVPLGSAGLSDGQRFLFD